MRSTRRFGITAMTAAIALSIGAVPVALTAGVLPGPDARVIEPASLSDIAELRLAMEPSDGRDTVTQYDGNNPVSVQDLIDPKSGCTLGTTGPSLLSITAMRKTSAANVGFDVDAIGVAEKNGGESCAQVGSVGNEKLILRPGVDLGASFKSASLDVELKQSAAITGTAKLNGDTVWTFYLTSGSTASGILTPVLDPGGNPITRQSCRVVSDSGPDAKAGDNCQWSIGTSGEDVTFDSLELFATAGSFSLEGGADYTSLGTQEAHRSVFTLDFSIDCLSSRALAGSTDGTVPVPEVTVTRLDNADGTTCEKINFRFTNGPQFAQFLKSPTDEPAAQFLFDFVWTGPAETTAAAPGSTSIDPLLARTTVDYEFTATPAPVTIAWCPDLVTTTVQVDGVATEVSYVHDVANNNDAVDQAPGQPAPGAGTPKQFACIVSQTSEVVDAADTISDTGPGFEEDRVVVRERIYVYGDIKLQRL